MLRVRASLGVFFCKQSNVFAFRFKNEYNKVKIALSVGQFWFEIKLVIVIVLPLRGRAIFSVTTRLISDQIALHSMQLPCIH